MEIRELIQLWVIWKTSERGAEYQYKMLSVDSGVSTSYISNIMTGARNAGVKTITRIAGAFGVTLAEFYAGPPEEASPAGMIDDATRDEPVEIGFDRDRYGLALSREPAREIDKLISSFGFDAADLFLENASTGQDEAPSVAPSPRASQRSPISGTIPVLDTVPPGEPGDWIGNLGAIESVPRDFGITGMRVCVVRMHDNSMLPDIRPQDIMVVDIDTAFVPDDSLIGIVEQDGRFIPRRISKRSDGFLLVPANPSYPATAVSLRTHIFKVVLFVPYIKHIF